MSLKDKLKQQDFAYGTWSQTGSPEVLEMLGFSGRFSFTIIDTEHGYYDLGHAENLVRAADASGIPSIVRVGMNDPHLVTKALDTGTQGVCVPGIGSVEEAQRFVDATRFGPKGNRGACPFIRAGGHLVTDWNAYASKANENIFTMALVEGEKGLNALDDIAAVEGLDAIMIGPMDLTVSLGIGGQLDHPKLKEFVEKAVKTCDKHDVMFFMPNFHQSIEEATQKVAEFREIGVKYFTVGSDKLFLASYMRGQHDALAG